jgi:dihydroorotase
MRLQHVRLLTAQGLSGPRTMKIGTDAVHDVDATGLILSPGWMDLHAHLRDPGHPQKETLASGAASAAAGGFTHVVAMANTEPVTDRPERVRELVARSATLPVRVSFVGALTVALEGRSLTDAAALKAAGAVALSDDGRHAIDGDTLQEALRAAAAARLPVFIHAQDERMGTSPQAESTAVAEALDALRQAEGARLHIQHVSTGAAVDLLRAAKAEGLAVSAEVTPHHLGLTDEDAARLGPHGKVSPPLRTARDREALCQALLEGVIDVIATDHAPHELAAKTAGANGFHGFETAVSVVLGLGLPASLLHRACVQRPRDLLGQSIDEEWALIDPDAEWTVDPARLVSRGRNTPFAGRWLRGRVVMTVCRGRIVFERVAQRV